MDWAGILLLITTMTPVEAVLSTLFFSFMAYRGFINIPILIKKNKNKNKKEDPNDLLAIHKTCKNYSSFLVILERSMKDSADIIQIRYISTIYDQMNLAEESWRRIRVDLREAFVENLHNDITDLRKQEAKICYNLVILLIPKWIFLFLFVWHTDKVSQYEYCVQV